MTRRKARKSTVGISLFPFLAVLICTMGALIVLLVIVMHQGRVHADTIDRSLDAAQAAEREAKQIAYEDQTWRAEVLQQQREEIQQQLADKRLEIAHLEEHIRELEQRWKQLKNEAEQMQQLRADKQQDATAAVDQLAQLKQRLATAQQELEKAREAAAQRQRTYTIIPYPGPNGTTRRPIYVECTDRGIILQPENIVLRPDDFNGSLGPGNPLDAALRAIREYYARNAVDPQQREEPYPLLIIRPDGVSGYAVAREAMSAWEDEFGYELVSDELQLNYAPPDPALAALLQKAIADARSRQERLRRAMPASPRGGGFVVSEGRGGVVPLGGSFSGSGSGVGSGRGGVGNGSGKSEGDRKATSGAGDAEQQSRQTDVAGEPSSKSAGLVVGANGAGPAGTSPLMQMPSMAQSRGADWALEDKPSHATGYRRTVRVVCEAERLVLTPEPGSESRPRFYAFEQDPTRAVDECVQDLKKRMKLWGLAPIGGYWRPQLKVVVAPGGEQRYLLLEHLLRDSGLEIVRDNQ